MVDARDQPNVSDPSRARRRLVLGACLLAVVGAAVSLWLPWWRVDVEIATGVSTVLGRSLPQIAAESSLGVELGIEAPSAWAILALAVAGAVAAVAGSRGAGRATALAALLAGLVTIGTAGIAAAEGDPTLEAMADRKVAQLTGGRVAGADELTQRIGSILGSDAFDASLHTTPRIGLAVTGASGVLVVAGALIAATARARGGRRAR